MNKHANAVNNNAFWSSKNLDNKVDRRDKRVSNVRNTNLSCSTTGSFKFSSTCVRKYSTSRFIRNLRLNMLRNITMPSGGNTNPKVIPSTCGSNNYFKNHKFRRKHVSPPNAYRRLYLQCYNLCVYTICFETALNNFSRFNYIRLFRHVVGFWASQWKVWPKRLREDIGLDVV